MIDGGFCKGLNFGASLALEQVNAQVVRTAFILISLIACLLVCDVILLFGVQHNITVLLGHRCHQTYTFHAVIIFL